MAHHQNKRKKRKNIHITITKVNFSEDDQEKKYSSTTIKKKETVTLQKPMDTMKRRKNIIHSQNALFRIQQEKITKDNHRKRWAERKTHLN